QSHRRDHQPDSQQGCTELWTRDSTAATIDQQLAQYQVSSAGSGHGIWRYWTRI
ncbi:hypothetical protein GGI19_006669, partial [Coemansia pectinata]